MKKDGIKKQWEDAADAWLDFVRSGKDWTREYVNNPAMFKMLGNIRGKTVLDLGCGEGYNTRMMARKGAKVTAVDFSKRMIALAVKEERRRKLGIDYRASNACDLRMFGNETFDIVACFNALQDIKDYRCAIKEASRVMKGHGRFVSVIPHPCFEVRVIGGKRIGGWEYKKGAEERTVADLPYWTKDKLIANALYFTVDRYFDVCKDVVQWKMERLTKHFKTTSFHRTLTDYSEALRAAGLLISRLKEPRPTKRGLARHPGYFGGNLRIPQSIVFEAVKR